jgi:hypothetical protein
VIRQVQGWQAPPAAALSSSAHRLFWLCKRSVGDRTPLALDQLNAYRLALAPLDFGELAATMKRISEPPHQYSTIA